MSNLQLSRILMYCFIFAGAEIFSSVAFGAACSFESPAVVIEVGPSHLLEAWNFTDGSVIGTALDERSEPLSSYRRDIQAKINTDASNLLERYSKTDPDLGDRFNLEFMLKNISIYTRPIGCLEALLLSEQLRRNPQMENYPTEFFAVLLESSDSHLRVYNLTDDMNGVRKLDSLFAALRKDLTSGWRLVGNLHNHSFFLSNLDLDEKHHPQGVLSPSANDISIFESMASDFDLPSASITNGFDTIKIPASDFKLLRGQHH